MKKTEWTDVIVPVLSLASAFEDEGNYNLAKLARATIDSLCRRAAYLNPLPRDSRHLAEAMVEVTEMLSSLGVGEEMLTALRRGAAALSDGTLLMINEAPHPHVCRTCGHMVLGEVTNRCPTCGAWRETFQLFPPNYWLDALDPFAAIETLRKTPSEVSALLNGLSEEDMTRQPLDGGWAIRNVVSHLRDAQTVLDFRLDLFAQEEHPSLESKAVWTWATSDENRPPTTIEVFSDYMALRAKITKKLEVLPLADWWRTGQHAEFGVVSIKQQVSYFAAHELTHLPQLERLRNLRSTNQQH